jgi:hypothetical protein
VKTALIIAASALLSGCARNQTTPINSLISENYRPVVGASGNPHKVEPQYIHASSADEAGAIYKQYVECRVSLSGIQYFHARVRPMDLYAPKQRDILEQARLVHADIVLYFTVPQGYVEMNVPVASSVSPGTLSQTQSTRRMENSASPIKSDRATTWTPGEIHWQYGQRSVARAANYVEFLAR